MEEDKVKVKENVFSSLSTPPHSAHPLPHYIDGCSQSRALTTKSRADEENKSLTIESRGRCFRSAARGRVLDRSVPGPVALSDRSRHKICYLYVGCSGPRDFRRWQSINCNLRSITPGYDIFQFVYGSHQLPTTFRQTRQKHETLRQSVFR